MAANRRLATAFAGREELTGEPGDAVIMHPRLLHVGGTSGLPHGAGR